MTADKLAELLSNWMSCRYGVACKCEPSKGGGYDLHVTEFAGVAVRIPRPVVGGSSWVGSPVRQLIKVHTILPICEDGKIYPLVIWQSTEL